MTKITKYFETIALFLAMNKRMNIKWNSIIGSTKNWEELHGKATENLKVANERLNLINHWVDLTEEDVFMLEKLVMNYRWIERLEIELSNPSLAKSKEKWNEKQEKKIIFVYRLIEDWAKSSFKEKEYD